jgi:hypothetical protein
VTFFDPLETLNSLVCGAAFAPLVTLNSWVSGGVSLVNVVPLAIAHACQEILTFHFDVVIGTCCENGGVSSQEICSHVLFSQLYQIPDNRND